MMKSLVIDSIVFDDVRISCWLVYLIMFIACL